MRTDENNPVATDFDPSMTDPFAHVGDGSSLSGHERNVLHLSREGRQFENLSGVSGADDPADGRAVGLLDYDRDGWQDLVIVNANAPQLQLFRNEIGRAAARSPKVVALRFVGGNRGATPAPGLSPRDGTGARVELDVSDATLVRVHRSGEGFAAQNSATLLVGLGEASEASALRVFWPSGRMQTLGPVPAGTLVTLYEEASESPGGSGFETADYRIAGLADGAAARYAARERGRRTLAVAANGEAGDAPLRLITTMATWCETCKGELPQVARLREAFDPSELALLGVPIDEDDTPEKLAEYERENAPAYALLKTLPEAQIEAVRRAVIEGLRVDALPAAIVTDAEGHVLRTLFGVPDVSLLRELLAGGAS